MAKSFCGGCKHWELYRAKPYGDNYDASERFHYCNKYNEMSLKRRKTICNGVYYEKKD